MTPPLRLADPQRLDLAAVWLRERRGGEHENASHWPLLWGWEREREQVLRELEALTYRLEPRERWASPEPGEPERQRWRGRDALVLKALAGLLQDLLPLSRRCTHLKGQGGLKGALRQVRAALPRARFVCRTDVASYYASIDPHRLQDMLAGALKGHPDRSAILSLTWQATQRSSERGGLFRDHHQGIARGCPLSPVLGAFFLRALDERLERLPVFAVRYMDDVLILAESRWKLRRAVRVLNQTFAELGLSKHPDKTFIGRVERGFDFLGYRFGEGEIKPAQITVRKFLGRLSRLHEQKRASPDWRSALGVYVRRWWRWVTSGGVGVDPEGKPRELLAVQSWLMLLASTPPPCSLLAASP